LASRMRRQNPERAVFAVLGASMDRCRCTTDGQRRVAARCGWRRERRSAAMAMVGHKTGSTYRRYAIVDAAVLRKAAEKADEASGTLLGTPGEDRARAEPPTHGK